MTESKINSVRGLARELGLSKSTISAALRNHPAINQKTREKIQVAAKSLGYRYNPLVGEVMSEIRRSSAESYRYSLGIVDLNSNRQRNSTSNIYHAKLLAGAKAAASEMRCSLDHFVIGSSDLPLKRLDSILESRGIKGLAIMPVLGNPDLEWLTLDRTAIVYMDYLHKNIGMHTVCVDHYLAMITALEQLQAKGYRRPGLFLNKMHDERLQCKWQAAFKQYTGTSKRFAKLDPLVTVDQTKELFLDWFQTHQPDVVIAHNAKVVEWMQSVGCRVPETHGFCCLNLSSIDTWTSGLDFSPEHCGKVTIEMLVAQLHQNKTGIPDIPINLMYSAVWRDGPTLND